MAVFDHSEHVMNGMMKAQSTETTPQAWQSQYFTNPDSDVFFWGLINPGHDGEASVINYYFDPYWNCTGAVTTDIDFKWSIKGNGAAGWSTITTGLASFVAAANVTLIKTGAYEAGTTMPAQIRLTGTSTRANIYCKMGPPSSDHNFCSVRVYGTITT